MIDLSHFPLSFNVAVIGASGGVGKALAEHLDAHSQVNKLYCFSRSSDEHIYLDLSYEGSIQQAANFVDVPLHLVIVATGVLHSAEFMPEKSLRDLDAETMRKVFEVNTIGPALVAKYFIPLMAREGKGVFSALSARVGSVSDNRLGGWYSYRASKTALNMIIKNISIEAARKYKELAVIGLHPGTVDTGLSEPFQSNVSEGKLFSPESSARYLLDVVNLVQASDSGKVFAWDGQEIEA